MLGTPDDHWMPLGIAKILRVMNLCVAFGGEIEAG